MAVGARDRVDNNTVAVPDVDRDGGEVIIPYQTGIFHGAGSVCATW